LPVLGLSNYGQQRNSFLPVMHRQIIPIFTAFLLGTVACNRDAPGDTGPPNLLFTYNFSLEAKPAAEQIDFLQNIGFEGITCLVSDANDPILDAYAATPAVQTGRFRVVAVYYYMTLQQGSAHYTKDLALLLPKLKALNADLWVVASGWPGDDRQWADLLRQTAAQAAEKGVKAVIYPHDTEYVESARHALRLIQQAGHPNLGLSFHLCHEMRAGHANDMESVIRDIAPHLQLASLSGTFTQVNDNSPTWEDAILPLDRGDYDVQNVFRLLRQYGYHGPIALHTYGITEPDHWQRSFRIWQTWTK
jgi:sugar phosphate isomerase/epimerase